MRHVSLTALLAALLALALGFTATGDPMTRGLLFAVAVFALTFGFSAFFGGSFFRFSPQPATSGAANRYGKFPFVFAGFASAVSVLFFAMVLFVASFAGSQAFTFAVLAFASVFFGTTFAFAGFAFRARSGAASGPGAGAVPNS